MDENPFNENTILTGMRGKITVTHNFVVDSVVALVLKSTYKSSNGTAHTKKNSFYVAEATGRMTECGE